MNHCIYCDPEKYVVYGYCNYCGNMTRPSLHNAPDDSLNLHHAKLIAAISKQWKEPAKKIGEK